MKRTRNICIRALCAIFIGVALGCSGSDGGSDIENDGGNGDNGQEAEWQQPAFYINEELGGQRFVEEKTNWLYDNQGYTKFTARCDDANKYIDGKVAELQELWQEKNTGSALSDQINTALNNFNYGTSINEKIDNNYNALAPVMSKMENTLLNNNEDDFNKYRVSYYKLAHNAYQNSLGSLSKNPTFRVNQQMLSDTYPNNYFAGELADANLSYSELTVKEAKKIMENSLTKISANTNTSTEVLKKIIALALYNESLYGLNDYAEIEKVDRNLRHQHSITDMGTYIYTYGSNMTRNIDDRTM